MHKSEIFHLMNQNPAFFLATLDDNQPRVRGMLLYKADESGILFHTGAMKDIFKQIMKNPKVELCFVDFKSNTQVRVSGELEVEDDIKLKEEISEHPSRQFLKPWKERSSLEDFYNSFIVFRLKHGLANIWSIETNFSSKKEIKL